MKMYKYFKSQLPSKKILIVLFNKFFFYFTTLISALYFSYSITNLVFFIFMLALIIHFELINSNQIYKNKYTIFVILSFLITIIPGLAVIHFLCCIVFLPIIYLYNQSEFIRKIFFFSFLICTINFLLYKLILLYEVKNSLIFFNHHLEISKNISDLTIHCFIKPYSDFSNVSFDNLKFPRGNYSQFEFSFTPSGFFKTGHFFWHLEPSFSFYYIGINFYVFLYLFHNLKYTLCFIIL